MKEIKRYAFQELQRKNIFNEISNNEQLCKSKDVDHLITDHKAVVEELEKEVEISHYECFTFKERNKELEKENKELRCCGNCRCYELGMCYFIDYAPVGLRGCNYCKNWIKK